MISQTLTISDEVYQQLSVLAKAHGQTLEDALATLVHQAIHEEARDPLKEPRYQTFEEFFHDLGMTDEQIAAAQKRTSDHADV